MILTLLKKKISQILLVVTCSLVSIGFSSSLPLIYKFLIDNVIMSNKFQDIYIYILILLILAIEVLALNYTKEKVMYNTTDYISRKLRESAFENCLKMKYFEFEKIGYQKMLKSITREVGRICDVFINNDIPNFVFQSIQLIFIFSMMMILNWKIAILFFIISPTLFLIMKKSRTKIEILDSKLINLLIRCDNFLTHSLLGIKTVKTFCGENYELNEFKQWLDENAKVSWKIKNLHNFIKYIIPTVLEQFIVATTLVISGYFVAEQQMSIGELVAIISYVPLLFRSLNETLGIQIKFSELKNSLSQIDEIFTSSKENGNALVDTNSNLVLDVENLSFSYGRKSSNITIPHLNIEKGQFIAVVGESGTGKSVIFDIICKFYKTEVGKFNFYGHDINEVDTQQLRNMVKLVSQNTFLWNKSIKENIIYPNQVDESFNIEKYKKCIEITQPTNYIDSLPKKDETILGDFGSQISGGEAQRISLARAFYSDYSLLLLDEPTSALDSVASNKIINTIIGENKKGKTVIMITHNISQALLADKIAFIRNGKLDDFNSPQSLIKTNIYFKEMYQNYCNKEENNL